MLTPNRGRTNETERDSWSYRAGKSRETQLKPLDEPPKLPIPVLPQDSERVSKLGKVRENSFFVALTPRDSSRGRGADGDLDFGHAPHFSQGASTVANWKGVVPGQKRVDEIYDIYLLCANDLAL